MGWVKHKTLCNRGRHLVRIGNLMHIEHTALKQNPENPNQALPNLIPKLIMVVFIILLMAECVAAKHVCLFMIEGQKSRVKT